MYVRMYVSVYSITCGIQLRCGDPCSARRAHDGQPSHLVRSDQRVCQRDGVDRMFVDEVCVRIG